jgi:hypothetical protein
MPPSRTLHDMNKRCVALFLISAATGCVDGMSSVPSGNQAKPAPGPGGSEAGNPLGDITFAGGKLVPGSSCGSVGGEVIVGDGNLIDRPRAVTGFTQIRQEAVVTTAVSQAPSFTVSVRIDANLQDIMTTTVENGVLVLRATKSFCTRAMPSATIALPRFLGATIAGVGDLTVTGVTGADAVALVNDGVGDLDFAGTTAGLSLDVSGVGAVKLAGRTTKLDITASGVGDIDASGLTSVDATLNLSGIGDVRISASGSVTVTADCIGDVAVSGGARVPSGSGLCQVHGP